MKAKKLGLLLFASLLLGLFSIAAASPEVPKGPGVPVPKTELERLTGSYTNLEMGVTFKIDLEENRLVLNFTEGPAFKNDVLIPVSSTRFRIEGEGLAPGLQVTFQLPAGGGKAEFATVIQPRMPVVVMKRVN